MDVDDITVCLKIVNKKVNFVMRTLELCPRCGNKLDHFQTNAYKEDEPSETWICRYHESGYPACGYKYRQKKGELLPNLEDDDEW